jgi:Mannosyltransferase (PIG-V)
MTAVTGEVETTTEAQPEGKARPRVGDLATPLLLFAATRVVQLLFIAWLAPAGGPSIRHRLLAWDGDWFMRVATEGYPHTYSYDNAGQMVGNGLAFFPAYPVSIRLLWELGIPADVAALIVSWVAAAAAVVLLYLLGTAISGRRVGLALTVLFAAQPMSVVLSMGYSEALFCAFVIGMFYAAYRNAFLIAGVLGFLAGMTRPTGLAAAAGLVMAAVLAIRGRQAGWRAVVGAVVALAGVPSYLLWVGLRVHDLGAWFTIQTAGWGTTFDSGSSTWNFLYTAFHQGNGWVQVSIAMILVAAIVATILAVRHTWPPIVVYGLLVMVLVVGQAGYYHSKPRLLLPALLTILPAAHLAARSRPRAAALGLTAYALFGLWFGAYLTTVWVYTI